MSGGNGGSDYSFDANNTYSPDVSVEVFCPALDSLAGAVFGSWGLITNASGDCFQHLEMEFQISRNFPPFQTEIDMMSWCRSSNLLGLWKKADDFLTLAKCIVLIRRNQRNGAVGNTVQGQISHTWESHLQFCGTQGTTILCWSCRPATPSWIWEEGRHKKFCFTTELDTPEKPPASLISRDLCRENHPGMSMVSNILQSTLIQKPTDSMISHDIRLRRGPPADKLRKNKDPCPQVGKGCPKLNINKVSTIAATTWCRHKHYFSHSPEKHVVARKTCWTLMNMSKKTGNIEHHIISYNII